MRFVKFQLALLAIVTLAVSPARAEINTFVGADTVDTELEFRYSNGTEIYEFEQLRVRYGWETTAGSFGLEILSGDEDDTLDPFGTPFAYEVEPALGFYATLGKPVYLKIGWSTWKTIYTDLSTGVPDSERVHAYEIGLGFNLPLGRIATIYADYSLRDTDGEYPSHLTGSGLADLKSELISVGLNILF